MRTTINQYVFMSYEYLPDYSKKMWVPDLWSVRVADAEDRIFIGMQDIEVEIPDDFNPVPQQVAAIKMEQAAALAEYQDKVATLQERLSKLLALEAS
jgi:hypothetical protein